MKKYLIFCFIVMLLISSCKKFLTEYPEAEASTGTFYKTQSDFNSAVIACYSALRSYPSTEIFPLVEYRSDNLFVKSYTSGSQDQYMINKFTDNSSNSLTDAAWNDMYQGISYCNDVISRINSATFNATTRAQYEGESRFIRALYYFTLVRFFGNLPIVDHPIDPNAALQIPRSPVSDVYTFIEADLNKAITELPETYAPADLGRITVYAAKTLLAKVYINENKFAQAQPLLTDVISSGDYQLQSSIANVFSVNNEMNNEVIFAIRFNKSVIGGGHSPWFSLSDTTISPLNLTLKNEYNPKDERSTLLNYTKAGNVYYIDKFNDSQDANTKTVGNDFIVLRYADVLLMYAECLNETGQLSNDPNDKNTALYWLNLVRTRSLPSAPITVAQFANQNDLRQLIYQERKLEFPLEGGRWFDLQRTKMANQVMNQYGISVPDYRLIYPVPNIEVEKINNASIFPQNPQYN